MNDLTPLSKLGGLAKLPLSPRIPLPGPLALLIEFTNKCNFACKFCPESFPDYMEQAGGEHWLDFDKFKKICADILELGRLKVVRYHTMGEVLLHRDAIAMFRYAAGLRVADRTELTTNATAINPKRAAELVDCGLDYIRVSIYGMDPERHKRITASNISPKRIEANIRALYEARARLGAKRPFIHVKMLDPYDAAEQSAFLAAYRDIADEVLIDYAHEWNGSDSGKLLGNVYGDRADEARSRPKVRPREVCPLPFYQPAIHSDGKVSMCHVDWNNKTTVGNVFEESLAQIWRGERIRNFQKMQIERRRHENEACRNCTFFFDQPDDIDDLVDSSILDR